MLENETSTRMQETHTFIYSLKCLLGAYTTENTVSRTWSTEVNVTQYIPILQEFTITWNKSHINNYTMENVQQ